MNPEIVEFWKRNNTPIGLMVQNAYRHGTTPQQVEIAAQIVYEEAQEIIENLSEIKPGMNGKQYEKVVLLRNQLKPNMLGWRVFIIAKSIKAIEYDTELVQSKKIIEQLEEKIERSSFTYRFKQWLKTIKWELDEWQ